MQSESSVFHKLKKETRKKFKINMSDTEELEEEINDIYEEIKNDNPLCDNCYTTEFNSALDKISPLSSAKFIASIPDR